MHNKTTETKKISFLFCLLLITVILFGCASTGQSKHDSDLDTTAPEERLFSDWQYSGFGSEYPEWAEKIILGVKQEEALFVIITDGENVDICKVLADEKSILKPEENLINETWVKINPNYERFENPFTNPYVYIKIYSE